VNVETVTQFTDFSLVYAKDRRQTRIGKTFTLKLTQQLFVKDG